MSDDLAKDLEEAHHIIRCLLHLAGGTVDIPDELIMSMDRHRLMQVDRSPLGGMTLTLEGRLL
ncbi:hypothetical protein ABZW11_26535 [Nonomuraea sp. NPDC004580]|uniref:hypothetical protein n=1 Tax=Nonomuraea sp. NPDC004580 TaxID=3154552 RepID=UPI00339EF8E2